MLSYKDSGVDIDEGNALVDGLKPLVQSTFDANVIGGIGSFAGAYAMPSGYRQPVILGATDGVGTKLRLAIDSDILESVGIDLVAMCANDLICNFATPIFFLDYYATGKLDKSSALRVIEGIVEGCKLAQCALIGGESAEMPGMYAPNDFDLAGFAVGIAEREDLERVSSVQAGDVLIALPSSGLHSNGYSLVRKVLERANLTLDSVFEGMPLSKTLLTPTRIYVKTFLELKNHIKALAHITGGGIVENLGEPAVGFFQARSHLVVDCGDCYLQPLPAMAAAGALRRFMAEDNITAWDPRWEKGLMRHLIVKTGFSSPTTTPCLSEG